MIDLNCKIYYLQNILFIGGKTIANRPNILALASKISLESMTYTGITYKDPEYRILEPIVDDDMCSVMMRMRLEKEFSAEEQMKIETSRCLGCGAAVVDESLCVGCGICTTKCKFDAIHLEKVTDYVGAPYFKALLGAAGNAPAAVAKLVTKKIARK